MLAGILHCASHDLPSSTGFRALLRLRQGDLAAAFRLRTAGGLHEGVDLELLVEGTRRTARLEIGEDVVLEPLIRLPAAQVDDALRREGTAAETAGVDLAGESEPFKPLEAKKASEMDAGVYDNGQFRLDQSDPQHAFFLVRSQNTKFFTGFSSLRTFDLGDGVKVTPGTTKLGWCTISLVSLTGTGFGKGSRILLAATGLSHNGGAKFSHFEGVLWHSRDDDFGTATTVTEGVRAKIVLPFADVRCRVLDGDGVRGREVPVTAADGISTIEIGPEYKTVWYEVEAMK